jgi:TP901 family phage tail tape measure protein
MSDIILRVLVDGKSAQTEGRAIIKTFGTMAVEAGAAEKTIVRLSTALKSIKAIPQTLNTKSITGFATELAKIPGVAQATQTAVVAAFNAINGAAQQMGVSLKTVGVRMQELKVSSSGFGTLVKELGALNQRLTQLEKQVKGLGGAFATAQRSADSMGKATAGAMQQVNNAVKKTSTNVKALNSQMQTAGATASTSFRGAAAATGIFNTSLRSLLLTLRTITGLLAFFAVFKGITTTVSTLRDFEFEMSKVNAISRATGFEFQMLSNKARQLGSTTVFTSTEAAEAMRRFAMAGFTVGESMAGADKAIRLAVIGNLDLERSVEIIGDTMRQFNLKASDMNQAISTMAATITSSNITAEQYAQALRNLSAPAKLMGMNLQEASAIVGILGNNVLKGANATTALRTQLIRLYAPTDKAKAMMKTLGLEMANSDGTLKKIGQVVDEFSEKLSKLTEEDRMKAIGTIFQARSMAQMAILLSLGSKRFEEYNQKVSQGGVDIEMYNKMSNNLHMDIKMLGSAFQEFILTLGDGGLLGALRSSTQFMTEFFRGLVNARVQLGFTKSAAEELAYLLNQLVIPAWKGLVWIMSNIWNGAVAIGKIFVALTGLQSLVDSLGTSFSFTFGFFKNELAFYVTEGTEVFRRLFEATFDWLYNKMMTFTTSIASSITTAIKNSFQSLKDAATAALVDASMLEAPLLRAIESLSGKMAEAFQRQEAFDTKNVEYYSQKVEDAATTIGNMTDKAFALANSFAGLTVRFRDAANAGRLFALAGEWVRNVSNELKVSLNSWNFENVISQFLNASGAVKGFATALDYAGRMWAMFSGGNWQGGMPSGDGRLPEDTPKPGRGGGGGGGSKSKKTAADMIKELAEQLEGVQRISKAWEQGKDAATAMKAEVDILAKLRKDDIKATDDQVAQIIKLNQEIENQNSAIKNLEESYKILNRERDRLTLLREAGQAIQDTMSPQEKMVKELERANELLPYIKEHFMSMGYAADAAAAKATEVSNRLKELAKDGQTFGQTMQQVEGIFVNGFTNMISQGKSFKDTLRDIGKQLLSMAANWVFKSIFGKIFGSIGFADGGVFSKGAVQAYANGGIVSRPTLFPMANGTGLMGEAGPEAVMPLRRLPSGKLGVHATGGGGVSVVNHVAVTVQGNNNDEDKEFGKRLGKEIGVIIDGKMTQFVNKQRRPGGMLYQGVTA